MTVSVHLGLSLCGVSLREHIRQTYLWTLFLSITMLGFATVRIALSALGIEVSRRAVAKYRMALDIPPSSQRKKR